MRAFQATIDGRFASLAKLVDEAADLDSLVTYVNSSRTSWQATSNEVTPTILDLCDQRQDLNKKRNKPEGAKD